MEQLKKCQYCTKIGKFVCSICGSWVCEDHYDGVCSGCKEKS